MNAAIYEIADWNRYAQAHASVITSYQLDLYREASQYLSGNVADCGCGSARLAPLLAKKSNVSSYTGIDCSEEMVAAARWILSRLNKPAFTIECSLIENIHARFSSAVSIHSYYSWPDPCAVLSHIYQLLAPKALFVLATPNPELAMQDLLVDVESELIAHPYFDEFKQANLRFAENPNARFVTMDHLVGESRDAGFQLLECHQRHYNGGVNFLLLRKSA
jgi:SAM-dependent methyltransferase